MDTIIVNQLRAIAKEYGAPRKTEVLYEVEQTEEEPVEEVPDYPVRVFFTREGYFKKITPQSLRMSGEQKLKEGDAITQEMDTTNAAELMFFTNLGQVYKSRAAEFEDTKASVMGDYVASKLGMDTGEVPVYMALFTKYEGYMPAAKNSPGPSAPNLRWYMPPTCRRIPSCCCALQPPACSSSIPL